MKDTHTMIKSLNTYILLLLFYHTVVHTWNHYVFITHSLKSEKIHLSHDLYIEAVHLFIKTHTFRPEHFNIETFLIFEWRNKVCCMLSIGIWRLFWICLLIIYRVWVYIRRWHMTTYAQWSKRKKKTTKIN